MYVDEHTLLTSVLSLFMVLEIHVTSMNTHAPPFTIASEPVGEAWLR